MLKRAPRYSLSRRYSQAARMRVCFHLITALAHREARGIIGCVICNKREDSISATTLLMCTMRVSSCKSRTHVAAHTNVTHIIMSTQAQTHPNCHAKNPKNVFPRVICLKHFHHSHDLPQCENKAPIVGASGKQQRNQYRDHSLKVNTTCSGAARFRSGLIRRGVVS